MSRELGQNGSQPHVDIQAMFTFLAMWPAHHNLFHLSTLCSENRTGYIIGWGANFKITSIPFAYVAPLMASRVTYAVQHTVNDLVELSVWLFYVQRTMKGTDILYSRESSYSPKRLIVCVLKELYKNEISCYIHLWLHMHTYSNCFILSWERKNKNHRTCPYL
jgi:hypothetical protein